MGDILVVIFVFCILLSTGLSIPTNRKVRDRQVHHHNDRAASAVDESTPSFDITPEIIDSIYERVMQLKNKDIPELFEEPTQDRQGIIKDRSLVKLIKTSKRQKFKLNAEDLFSLSNTTLEFSPSWPKTRSENDIIDNHELPLPKNITISDTRMPENKYEFVYTYVPMAFLADSSNNREIEIIKNTTIHTDPVSNNRRSADKNKKPRAKKNVRKYFRLHSSVAKEFEDNKFERKHASEDLGRNFWSPETDDHNTESRDTESPPDVSQTQTVPRIQSIVLRWNLILI